MRKSIFLLICLIALAFGSTSCKKSSSAVPCNTSWALALQDETNSLSNAILNYSQNPTPANCEAYKQAYLNYLNALKDWGNCVGTAGQTQEWRDEIKDAEDEINDIEC